MPWEGEEEEKEGFPPGAFLGWFFKVGEDPPVQQSQFGISALSAPGVCQKKSHLRSSVSSQGQAVSLE